MRATLADFSATRLIEADGDFFAIYDPDHDYEQRPRQGWATLVQSDAHDTVSDLSRPGMFRLNIGLTRQRFDELAGDEEGYDFTAPDALMPHPVYAAYGWVCVLNPDRSWTMVRQLLTEAHAFAARKHENAARRRDERNRRDRALTADADGNTGDQHRA